MLILRDIARELCLRVIRERGGGRLNVDSEDFEQERQSHICGEKRQIMDSQILQLDVK